MISQKDVDVRAPREELPILEDLRSHSISRTTACSRSAKS